MWTWTLMLCTGFVLLLSCPPSQSQHSVESGQSGENTGAVCQLPEEWLGSWNQADDSVINITNHSVDGHGTCVYMEELDSSPQTVKLVNRFPDRCYKLMLIIQVHESVIKYKEGACHDDLHSALEDSEYYFFVNIYRKKVIPCPFSSNSSYFFTYKKNGGLCSAPISQLKTCTTDSKRLLNFQACPDVDGTESVAKVLTCIGSWTEAGHEYLFAELSATHDHDASHRCLSVIRAADKEVVNIAIPEDSSCYPYERHDEIMAQHPNVLHLTKVPEAETSSSVKLTWLGVAQWNSLDESILINASGGGDTLTIFSYERNLLCLLEVVANHEHTHNFSIFSATKIVDCKRTPVCLHFYKRSDAVIEMAMYEDDHCELMTSNTMNTVDRVTLIKQHSRGDEGELVPCPFAGKYSVTKAKRNGDLIWKCSRHSFNTLIIGCPSHGYGHYGGECHEGSSIQFYSSCVVDSLDPVAVFKCVASWEENDKTYVVVRQGLRVYDSNDINSSNNVVTTARNQCLEIESGAAAEGIIYIKSNKNFCKKSYRGDTRNEWEVTAILLTDSTADKLDSSASSRVPWSAANLIPVVTFWLNI